MLQSFGGSQVRLLSTIVIFCLSLYYLVQDHEYPALPSSNANSNALKDAKYDLGPDSALSRDPPPDKPPYGALVIVANTSTELFWTAPVKITFSVHQYDSQASDQSDSFSRSNEANSYLSFIIDHYDDLPWSAFFVHETAQNNWLQENNMYSIINDINRVALARQGYFSLACEEYSSCAVDAPLGTDDWNELFPNEPIPPLMASPRGSQFVVTRQAIMKRPKSDFERIRTWLMSTDNLDTASKRDLESLWAYIFLREPLHCPAVEECTCKVLGRCQDGSPSGVNPDELLALGT